MEKITMIPQELHRDANGMNRVERIAKADGYLAEARVMAAAYIADPERGFADYADDECELCDSRETCGMKRYDDCLIDAAEGYVAAGLGILSERVDEIRYLPPSKAWAAFDEANLREDV